MMRRLLPAVLVPLLLLAAACGDDDDVIGGGGDGGDGGFAVDEDGLLVSIEMAGFSIFTPRHLLGSAPSIVVYNDGTVLTEGVVPAVYPGPAFMPVMKGQLDAESVDRIRDLAASTGLYDEDLDSELEDPEVTDLLSLVVTVGVGDDEVATAVYAHDESFDAGLPLATQEVRQRIRVFADEVERIVIAADANEIYQPDRYRVAALDIKIDEPEIEPGRAAWPFAAIPPAGDCTAIVGDDAHTLTALLADATEITIWFTEDGDEFQLDARPVLPHEPDCP